MFVTGFLFGLGFTLAGVVITIPFIIIKVILEVINK